ncbi:B12-binding domain-containing radical SAM protein [Lusitaniella coriacea]|uniref:B12-binding domain-containing radical SAM protein n=1 Tax=Lusitaniella coriacea TaxID=1983105 RepID=UPI003CF8725F
MTVTNTSSTTSTILVKPDRASLPPERFYQRFDPMGEILNPDWQRITTEESEHLFQPRSEGLHLLLINPPIREWSYPNIMPIGQGYVAAVAAMDGHHVDILDLNAERKQPVKIAPEQFSKWVEDTITQKLSQKKPDIIAIGGIITQYKRIKEISRLCKQVYPDVPVALGGGIASAMPDFMTAKLSVDIVMQGEGELTISELLHRLEIGASLKGLQGVAYREEIRSGEWKVRNNGWRPSVQRLQKGMDYLPWPMRSLWPVDELYKQNPVGHLNWRSKWIDGKTAEPSQYSISMIASRGCPYGAKACDYCFATYLGKSYRLRSPREVVDEMEYLKQRYEVAYIHFLDDLMLADSRWARKLCEELRERRKRTGFEVMWGGTCRTNIVADDVLRSRKKNEPTMLEEAYDAGMRQVGYGVETASPKILQSIDKSGQTPEKIEIAIEETKRVMGYADCSFMIGSPGETRETVQETVDVCRKVGLQPEVFFFTTAYPATSFWQLALDKGLIRKAVTGEKGTADDDIIEQYFLRLGEQGEAVRTNFSDLPDEEIEELSWWAINELKAQNKIRHPKTVSQQERKSAVVGATKADL